MAMSVENVVEFENEIPLKKIKVGQSIQKTEEDQELIINVTGESEGMYKFETIKHAGDAFWNWNKEGTIGTFYSGCKKNDLVVDIKIMGTIPCGTYDFTSKIYIPLLNQAGIQNA